MKKFLDEEGLKLLWQTLSLNDYPNNDTLIAVLTAIDESKADKEELVQSDWRQTNALALDYIKNKPIADDGITIVTESSLLEPIAEDNNSLFIENDNIVYVY